MSQDRLKVVWFEGMTLDPHHFQQWDRYQQGTLQARLRSVVHHDWGLLSLGIDREALANGQFALTHASGVMPDGFYFDVPGSDALPGPRNIQEHFGATDEGLPVFLVLPAERANGASVLLQGGAARQEARYAAHTASVVDVNTGIDERQIEVARANMRIRFGGESLGSYTTIQIAEVKRDASGAYFLDDAFIPTCLSISASDRLTSTVRRLVELLVAKATTLSERRQSILAQREISVSDMVALGLYGAVSAYLPQINHYLANSALHPEPLYRTMLGLAGQLTAWVTHVSTPLRDLPVYDHSNFSACFNRLDALLREMLGAAAAPSNYVQVRLNRERENLYLAEVDRDLLEGAQFFLIARSDRLSEDVLVTEMPRMVRIASPQTIEAVLRSYTRALAVEHTNRLPSGMPVDGRANYFQLQKRGPFWEAIVESGAMSVFVPAEFSEVNVQLVAVNRS